MECFKHNNRQAVGECEKCGAGLCPDCEVEIGGRVYCKGCVEKMINGGWPGPGYGYERMDRGRSGGGRSRGVYFLASLMPGAGLMYLGLIKRGLFFMAAFFLTIYFASSWGMGFLGLAIPVIWVAGLFDGFGKMRLMEDGIAVPDGVDDIMGFIRRNKNVLGLFLGILLLNWALGSGLGFVSSYLPNSVYRLFRDASRLMPLLLIIGGFMFLRRRRRNITDDGKREQ